jgi:superfamily II DNA or RNA helicase/Tfp pilus assembly protein PilF
MEKDILPPSSESSDQNELIPDPYTKGINFFKFRYYEKALSFFKEAQQLDPKDAEIWYMMGLTSELLLDNIKAKNYYEKAIQLDGEHVDALKALSDIKIKEKEFSDAEIHLKKVLSINQKDQDSQLKLKSIKDTKLKIQSQNEIMKNRSVANKSYFTKANQKEKVKKVKKKKTKTNKISINPQCSIPKQGTMNIKKIGIEALKGEGLAYEEFRNLHLKGSSDVKKLAIIDDELMIYTYYKEYGLFVPTLKRDFIGYKTEYTKLENAFSSIFFGILKQRIQKSDFKKVDGDYFKDVKENFIQFRKLINSNLASLTNKKATNYFGTTEVDSTVLFFKKMLREMNISPEYVRIASEYCAPGSALFFLELYSLLKDERTINIFQENFSNIDSNEAWELINSPKILLFPWDHQIEAFNAWESNNHHGILEMATATGKTLVGMMAIEALGNTQKKGVVRIFAHSRAILNQWKREAIDKFGLPANTFSDFDIPLSCNGIKIYFNTLQTVYKNPQNYPTDLLIVDEVHHSAASKFKKALSVDCKWKLGLSATIDGSIKKSILTRGLGPIVYTFAVEDAISRGVLPKFEWKLHTVYLSIDEEMDFRRISDKITKLFNYVKNDHITISKLSKNKFRRIDDLYEFVKLVETARYEGFSLPDQWRQLQYLILERRSIIHKSEPKINDAIKLAKQYLAAKKKVIVFLKYIETCDNVGVELGKYSDNIFVVHSKIKDDPNNVIMQFKQAEYGVLIGADMLNEGIDIPDAEIGINVSSSKTKLELVQRMGRVLRKKEGKKPVFHHYFAVPKYDSYVSPDDNVRYLDDLSWAQETALKLGVDATVENQEINIEKIRAEAEKMVSRRYTDMKILPSTGYGTLKLENILKYFLPDGRYKFIKKNLSELDPNAKITDMQWSSIVKEAFGKKKDEPLEVPGYWWLLIAGDRNPKKIIELFDNNIVKQNY